MIKDMNYFRRLDLISAGESIANLGTGRGASDVFGDAIQSLLIHCKEREVTAEEIAKVLGKPDRIRENGSREIWEYDWTDDYGPVNYASSTPFAIVNGRCEGLAPEA